MRCHSCASNLRQVHGVICSCAVATTPDLIPAVEPSRQSPTQYPPTGMLAWRTGWSKLLSKASGSSRISSSRVCRGCNSKSSSSSSSSNHSKRAARSKWRRPTAMRKTTLSRPPQQPQARTAPVQPLQPPLLRRRRPHPRPPLVLPLLRQPSPPQLPLNHLTQRQQQQQQQQPEGGSKGWGAGSAVALGAAREGEQLTEVEWDDEPSCA
mmetsp:Transcript_21559/g.56204  ORF Transcript_21559/g.56204 Transcript_21559/m.56204 type:complete len:209 (-) Transcript_21559:345-971(-)